MKSVLFFALGLVLAVPALPCKGDDATAGAPHGPVDYQGNLAKIPATDPPATDAPQLLAAIKGVHPRLLYTAAEIDALKLAIPTNPILKRCLDDNLLWIKRFKGVPQSQVDAMVRDDTATLATAMENYAALGLVYSLNHDPAVKRMIVDLLTRMIAEPYWADTQELDSNMGAANNMLMVAVLFDEVYPDLDPAFRAKVANSLLLHARRLYYLGHRQLAIGVAKYWQQDPQPNHRWYRDAGLIGALLAIDGEPGCDTDYLLEQARKEMDFVIKWYPPDGDCHEGAGYQVFGFQSLLLAAGMMDRDVGTQYLKAPGFSNAWAQQVYFDAPGRQSSMSFGDAMNDKRAFGYLDSAFFACAHLNRDPNVQAALEHRFLGMRSNPSHPEWPYTYPWSLLEFFDPTVGEGDYKALPTYRLFADLGAATMRDSWENNAVALAFKCGPYGGYKLNEYRETVKDDQGQPHYINVAHDDPDANSFALATSGDFLFHPGLYSLNKLTSSQSTITVDGKGQVNEGDSFTQPVNGVDMRTLAYLTGWKVGDKGRLIIEGEAGASYIGMNAAELKKMQAGAGSAKFPPAVLKRFRRTIVWLPGEYALILDDIRGNGTHEITWRGTVEKGQFDQPADGLCHASGDGGQRVDFQMLADQDFNGALDYCYLDGRFGSRVVQQFQFSLKTDAVRFACLLDPWKKKPMMTLTKQDDTVTLKIHSSTFDDVWTWQGAKDSVTPSPIVGTRGGAALISLSDNDKAPTS